MCRWIIIGIIGAIIITLFLFLLKKAAWKIDGSLLGLFLAGLVTLVLSILQPESIKYGEMEIKKYANLAKKSKEDAQKASKLALETMAMLTWNQGVWSALDKQKKETVVKGILKNLWGDDADKYETYMKKEGYYLIPDQEREKLPKVDFPANIKSEFHKNFLKNFNNE